jgi:hypothetical protein
MSDFHEPWTFGPSANGIQAKYDWAIADANGSKVCDSNDQLIPIDEHQARRIVAAVNAVAGIPTEVLERLVANRPTPPYLSYDPDFALPAPNQTKDVE